MAGANRAPYGNVSPSKDLKIPPTTIPPTATAPTVSTTACNNSLAILHSNAPVGHNVAFYTVKVAI